MSKVNKKIFSSYNKYSFVNVLLLAKIQKKRAFPKFKGRNKTYISNIPVMPKQKQKSEFIYYMISYHCEDVKFFITLQLCC